MGENEKEYLYKQQLISGLMNFQNADHPCEFAAQKWNIIHFAALNAITKTQ